MKLDDVICDIDKDITLQEKEIADLQKKKEWFKSIKEQYPDAQYENGSLCLVNIWDKITCMRIERKRRYYSTSKINVKFLLGKKHLVNGTKIYTQPYENTIAEIRHSYGVTRRKEILIFDYKKIIPPDCPRRNSFIKRIKFYLLESIMQDGLTVSDSSFDKDEFAKLMLLK